VKPKPDRAYLPAQWADAAPPRKPSPVRPLAVLIVAYRNPEQLAACLNSVREHLPSAPVFVWDNSGPGFTGVAELATGWRDVGWHLGSANIGFAAAVNLLAAKVSDHHMLLLNPDALLLGSLGATRAAMLDFGVAAAAPLCEDHDAVADGSRAHRPWDVAHRRRTPARALVAWAGYSASLRRTAFSDLYERTPTAVEGYLTGACLLINCDAWNAVGQFDEEFFLYGEESDWQYRALSAGWQVRLIDEMGVRHTGHGTVAGDALGGLRSREHLRANIALNIEHEHGVGPADIYLAGTSVLDRIQRSAVKARAARRRPAPRHPSVIITTNRLVYGGAERQHVVLATELDRRGFRVTIACCQRFGPLVADIPASVRVVRQPWWAPMVDIDDGPAVVITGDTNTETGFGTLWRAAGRNRRWLAAAHNPPNQEGATYSRGLAAAVRRADAFVALSPRHWEELTAHQNLGRRWFSAPNGVASAATLDEVRRRPAPSNPPHLVMLTRIVEHKNPHLLVEALAGLQHLPWVLSIYGDGPDRRRLEAMTPPELADRVRWRGWSPGPDHALVDCDLLCVPSRAEAFPLVVLEGMARRIPVVASSVCAVPDMLDSGRAGVLVDDISVQGWRTTLERLLQQPDSWSDIAEAGFARMRSEYTIEATADAYERAITAVFE
jgi:glycosyltransferase involved in cell wall biosynthesis/GT2 family glycosyltransferase